ncbi:MAG: hypothetical protein ACRD0V_10185 [Acidimicrobiales bacterium]
MSRHRFGRWRRAARRTANTRFHHADRTSAGYLPEASHVARSLR